MGRPRRKPPSPGRQWFVARRFPTLAASSFKAPLHGFPSSSACRHARHVPSEFVVARCDGPEVLEPAVAALDDVAILIGLLVVTQGTRRSTCIPPIFSF